MQIAYQGEPGAYSEAALREFFGMSAEAVACHAFADVFSAVESGVASAGVVPIENSLAGSVLENYDLMLERSVRIAGEVRLPVEHCLLGLPGAQLDAVRRVHSHPQALAQCMPFLQEHDVELIASYNTAGAARAIVELGDASVAAIASERAGEILGLAVLARKIQQRDDNNTRFFVIVPEEQAGSTGGKQIQQLQETGPSNKLSIAFTTANVPGALHRTLERFSDMLINLTKLESRPTRDTPWEYYFYVDCERADRREIDEKFLQTVLERISEVTDFVRVLGVYPAGNA